MFGHGGEGAVADVSEFRAERDGYVSRALGDELASLGVREVNVVRPARTEGFDGVLGGEAGGQVHGVEVNVVLEHGGAEGVPGDWGEADGGDGRALERLPVP